MKLSKEIITALIENIYIHNENVANDAIKLVEEILKEKFYDTFASSEEWYFSDNDGRDSKALADAWKKFNG